MNLTKEARWLAADNQASSPNDVVVYRNSSNELILKDGTAGEKSLDSLSQIEDHGGLTGLGDDDHTQYHTDARHLTDHDAAFNNALAITGDAGGKTTQGAHNADAAVHYPRPVQTLTVAEDDGQFGTILAALAVANANADATTPYEVAIYPGIYTENNLTVGDFVSLRAVIPWQVSIADSSVNPILIIAGESLLDGILISATGAGPGIQFTSAATGNVYLDHVSVASNTGSALDFNATAQDVNLDNGSRISSLAGPLISGKTAVCRIVARNTEFNYGGSSAVASMIDIDQSQILSAGPDLFDSCQFYADNLIGGTTPASFIDWDANVLWLRNCQFLLGVNTAKTVSAILAQSGTVEVQACKFDWVLTDGTPFDFNASGGATINHAATVYDVAKTTGAGSIAALSEGAALFDAVSMTGQLAINAADNPLINLTPSGTGSTDVISITPSGALAGANTWRGLFMDGAALDPGAASASVFGAFIDLSGTDQTNNPNLCGLQINMPASATTTQDFHAIKLTGNGNTLILLNKAFLIELISVSGTPLVATFSDSATNTIVNSLTLMHTTSADMVDGFGTAIELHVEDVTSGDLTIGRISASRAQGLDNDGKIDFGGGIDGDEVFLTFNGNGSGITLPLATADSDGLFFGAGTGSIYADALGVVINDPGKDPIIIGDTVTIKLGDAAGVEKFQVQDSASAVVFNVDSNGQLNVAQNIFHLGDTDTFIQFSVDQISMNAGGVQFLNMKEAATDEFVINDGGVDLDFRVEAVGKARAFELIGSTGDITMSETLTVGDGVADKILGITNGTATAMLGYDGIPHLIVSGDSQFQFLADDLNSDMTFVVKPDGTGEARVRAQTSSTEFIQMFHNGTIGIIDSNTGGIRLNDDVDFNGKITYSSSGGQSVGGISVKDNAVATVVSVATTPVQFLGFDTNDPTFGDVTPDHTNDHVTAGVDGKYMCNISATLESVSGGTQKFGIQAYKNNGSVAFSNVHGHRILQGGSSDLGSVSAQGLIDLSAGDTIELWVVNESSTGNILVEDCTLTLVLLAGT